MKAFHSDQAIKDKYLARLAQHRAADELTQGTGWKNGRGCAVGCTLENYDHASYETELGIPKELAGLEDAIFEGLPQDEAMLFPEQFLSAIKPGADLSLVWSKFAVWLLSDPEQGTINFCDDAGKAATEQVVALYIQRIGGKEPTAAAWEAAWEAAGAAAGAAARAGARAAAWAAARAAATAGAWDAAHEVAAYADVAYRRQRDKLLELMAECK